MAKSRIGILDGFRAIAIISVLFFHYFTRWAPPNNPVSLYPYDNTQFPYFKYGYLGVQFFFMISGFVIFYTLETTDRFGVFWKKRMIRLWPSIIVVTLITYLIFQFLDPDNIFPGSHEARNLIPSFTFITPEFFNTISGKPHYYSYINGVYWSLWAEIQFYLFVSVLFFLNKEKFVRNFLVLSIALIVVNTIFLSITGGNRLHIKIPDSVAQFYLLWIKTIFNLLNYLTSFAIGVIFYLLFKNKKNNVKTALFIKICLAILFVLLIYSGAKLEERIIFVLMFLLFLGFIYYPDKLSFLEKKIIVRIGVASYVLYLVHEHIALLIINRWGHYFYPLSYALPILLVFVMTWLSILYTERIDTHINKFLKKIFLVKN
ncbi:acyltransferase family protein [Ferruginibacter profundus]